MASSPARRIRCATIYRLGAARTKRSHAKIRQRGFAIGCQEKMFCVGGCREDSHCLGHMLDRDKGPDGHAVISARA